ncbi:MAG: aminotransferase class I/II-fold pyridoxal phosphate-dependent enzyme, partial [Candidatus Microgenomates bacterium]
LNHASIIDGCRLSKATVVRYPHNNLVELEKLVKENSKVAKKLIVTDGVFSMDGDISNLPGIVKIATKYDCLTMVDDAHGEGVLGKSGRGIVDHYHLHGQFDIEVGTLSKAFGVVGGFVAGKKIIVDWLRQKARPFLFSTSLSPADIASCIAAVDILKKSDALVKKMWANAEYFKNRMKKLGFDVGHSVTPIVPVMLMDEKLAVEFSRKLFEKGIFAVALCYPTVPMGKARIRVMISAAHTRKHLDQALLAFSEVKKGL